MVPADAVRFWMHTLCSTAMKAHGSYWLTCMNYKGVASLNANPLWRQGLVTVNVKAAKLSSAESQANWNRVRAGMASLARQFWQFPALS